MERNLDTLAREGLSDLQDEPNPARPGVGRTFLAKRAHIQRFQSVRVFGVDGG